jgi:hypothetical protein
VVAAAVELGLRALGARMVSLVLQESKVIRDLAALQVAHKAVKVLMVSKGIKGLPERRGSRD